MKKIIILIFVFVSNNIYTQEYFQQEVNYIINVTLNDELHTLDGFVEIDYTNNSNEELDVLWFHLWPNAYKNNSTALAQQKLEDGNTNFYYSSELERGYIDNIQFTVNGDFINWEYHAEHIDICKLILKHPLNPGETIQISTPFFVKIPDAKFSRLGHVKQSYMITQWYPKPAVYDKDGWHIMPYVDQGEFYSEFGSFDVKITLPSNYIVGATGNLQNESEINYLNQLAEKADTITDFGNDMSFPKSNSETKILHYVEKNIHDFGWFADKRFNVLKGEVELPYTKNKVILWCMFTNNEATLWKKSIEYMHDATYYYSLWNGDYPYKQCTAVDGTISAGGGMEYPGVTVIGESETEKALEEVIMHEVGHNWFYGILGSNERLHPWMDEGLNSHNEIRYMRTKYPEYNLILDMVPNKLNKILDLEDYTNKQTILELIMLSVRTGTDQPIELHSEQYTSMNYGSIVYMKTAIAFDYLMAYLGEELYDKCMQAYFEKWKFKHPSPKDLKAVFEDITVKNLDWFFDDMIQTTKQLDYAITNVKKENETLIIGIKNKGAINGPFVISGIQNGKNLNHIWFDGVKDQTDVVFPNKNYDYLQIDFNGDMPETNRNNNIIKLKGLFKKIEPLKFQFIGSFDHPKKTQIFFHPNYDWNNYDKSLLGITIYNRILPSNGFSYKFSPLYSVGGNTLAGNLEFSYEKYNLNSFIHKFKTGLLCDKYSYEYNSNNSNNINTQYKKIEPYVEIDFTKKNARSKNQSFIKSNFIHLNKGYKKLNFINTKYKFSNKRILNPYSINVNTQFGKDLQKADVTIRYKYALNKKRSVFIRGYLGFVNTDNRTYDLNMSGWSGINDYTFSNRFLGRSETNGFFSQQLIDNEGFIKHKTDITSNKFLTSISADFNLTKRFKLYTESGTNGTELAYGIGIRIPLGPVNIYIPLLTEKGLIKFDNIEFIRYNLKLDLSDIMILNL